MESESLANVPVVTRFVREVTGCNCPEEVFRHVEVGRGSTVVKSIPVDYILRIKGGLSWAIPAIALRRSKQTSNSSLC